MKKQIMITIPDPCHENWDQMTPTEQGKFCSVCSKEVLDFTNATDEDLVKRVMQGKNLCGRFKRTQLDRPMTLERKSGNSLLTYAASLLMPLSVLSTNLDSKPKGPEKPFVSLGIGSRTENPLKSIIFVSGYVKDETGKPIRNAQVFILEKGQVTRTNAEGFFNLKCASGSTLFVKFNELRSEDYFLGNTRTQSIEITLIPEVRTKTVYTGVGMIAVTPAEEISVVEKENEVVNDSLVKIKGTVVDEENPITICSIKEDTLVQTPKLDTTKVTVRGTVFDDQNLPLPGANVIIKGTDNGVQTDFDGNFELQAEKGQTLVFSFIGFETKEMAIGDAEEEHLTIKMVEETAYQRVLGGMVGYVVSVEKVEYFPSMGFQNNNYFDEEQRQNRKDRRAYWNKVKAFEKIKAARKKMARLLKRKKKNP